MLNASTLRHGGSVVVVDDVVVPSIVESSSSSSHNKRSYNESMNSSLKSLDGDDLDDSDAAIDGGLNGTTSDNDHYHSIANIKRLRLDKENSDTHHKLFKCDICSVSFSTIESFQYHTEQHQHMHMQQHQHQQTNKRNMWE